MIGACPTCQRHMELTQFETDGGARGQYCERECFFLAVFDDGSEIARQEIEVRWHLVRGLTPPIVQEIDDEIAEINERLGVIQ